MKRKLNQQEFFALPAVKAQQEIQMSHPHGSVAHRAAYLEICSLARQYGVGEYIRAEDY